LPTAEIFFRSSKENFSNVKGKEFSSFDNEILEKVNNKINDMAIEYIKKRQKLYRNSKTKEVYLAKANYNNYINSRVLSEEVSKRCSISATIVTMVLQEVESLPFGIGRRGEAGRHRQLCTYHHSQGSRQSREGEQIFDRKKPAYFSAQA
jgi:hypothetical protein